MNNRWLPALGVTAVALALAGCGSGSDSGSTSVRLANATLSHPSLDLLVNGGAGVSADASDSVSGYVTAGSGAVSLQVNDAGGSTSLSTTVPTLTNGAHYVLVAYESGGTVKTALIGEDVTLPAAGVTTLRIYDAAVEAGKIDVYITPVTDPKTACGAANLATISPVSSFGLLTAAAATSQAQGSGTYTVCATGAGSKTDLRMTLPITLTGQSVATILLTPASGGALLNGSLVVQQGAYTASRNTNARVRLAAAVTPGASVAASSSSGVVINGGSASPSLDFSYALVPAADSLNITVGGASVGAPAGKLPVGGDVTLLVYGTGTPSATLVADDNRLPSDQTTVKLRLINGVTGNTGNLTLTANNTPVGIGIAPGTAAPAYALVPGSANPIQFVLTSSSVANPLMLSNAAQVLSAATTYTVLAGGDVSAPSLLIR